MINLIKKYRPKKMSGSLVLAAGIWLIAISAGAVALSRYASTPGASANVVLSWPKFSNVSRIQGQPTLLLFAHPHCPCSKASINELERLMPSLRDTVQVLVVFIQPQGRTDQWVKGDLWRQVSYIPGVRAIIDPIYLETDRFGAKTSGQVFFYDDRGTLVFSGGITPARGHTGDSLGRDAILSWRPGKVITNSISKVYGCSLKQTNTLSANGSERMNDGT